MSDVDEAIDGVLMHYGKLGMKWGKRNARRKAAATKLVERKKTKAETTKRQIGKVKAKVTKPKGPASEDAARAAEIHKKVKAQGVQSLSNKEIQDLVTRINLVSNYDQAAQKRKSKGRQFAEKQMTEIGNDLRREVIKATVTGPVKTKLNSTFGDKKNKKLPMSAMWGE